MPSASTYGTAVPTPPRATATWMATADSGIDSARAAASARRTTFSSPHTCRPQHPGGTRAVRVCRVCRVPWAERGRRGCREPNFEEQPTIPAVKRLPAFVPLLLILIASVPSIAASPSGRPSAVRTTEQASPRESAAAPSESPAASLESGAPTESPAAAESPAPSGSPAPSQPACPTSTPAVPTPSAPVGIPQEVRLQLFQAIWQAIDQNYVDAAHNGADWAAARTTYLPEIQTVDDAAQIYSDLGTMVAGLDDPYSYYLTPDQVKALSSGTTTYGGIGTLLDPNDTAGPGVRILYVFPGGPADHAGLKSRDRILAVGGDPCVDVSKIRGEVGSTVTLTVQSPGG